MQSARTVAVERALVERQRTLVVAHRVVRSAQVLLDERLEPANGAKNWFPRVLLCAQAARQAQARGALLDELEAALGPKVRQRLLEALGGARKLAVAHVGEAEVVVERARVHGAQPRATRRRAAALDRAQQRHALVERLVALRDHQRALKARTRLPLSVTHVAKR